MSGTPHPPVEPPNVDAIVREIRAEVARRAPAAPGAVVPEELPPYGYLHETDQRILRDGWDVWNVDFPTPHRGVAARVLTAAKKAVRHLLAPVLGKQVLFNQ